MIIIKNLSALYIVLTPSLSRCLSPPLCTGEFIAGGTPAMDYVASYPGGVKILLAASWYGNLDTLQPDGPLGLYGDFTLPLVSPC